MTGTGKILWVATLAAVLGAVAGLTLNRGGIVWQTQFGQDLLERRARARQPVPDGVAVATVGSVIPAIELPTLDAGRLRLPGDMQGRATVINLWASWCGPCIIEMPELSRFAGEQGAKGTQVVGIALDDENAVREFLTRISVAYPIALDTPGRSDAGVRLGNARGVLPYTVLLDADGRLLKRKVGPFVPGELDTWARVP